jgi:hypothetical protein
MVKKHTRRGWKDVENGDVRYLEGRSNDLKREEMRILNKHDKPKRGGIL